jgi:hypothetical protein
MAKGVPSYFRRALSCDGIIKSGFLRYIIERQRNGLLFSGGYLSQDEKCPSLYKLSPSKQTTSPMKHITPSSLLSPREDTLHFLRTFARAYRPMSAEAGTDGAAAAPLRRKEWMN